MKFKYSAKKLGDLEEITEANDGITFKFALGGDGENFINSLFRNSEETDEEDATNAIEELAQSLIRTATNLSESLNCMVDDGYSITEFIPQSDLLCEILDFFKSFKDFGNDE